MDPEKASAIKESSSVIPSDGLVAAGWQEEDAIGGSELSWDGKSLSTLVRLAHQQIKANLEQTKKLMLAQFTATTLGTNGVIAKSNAAHGNQKKRRLSKYSIVDLTVPSSTHNTTKNRRVFKRIPSNIDPPFVQPYVLKYGNDDSNTAADSNTRMEPKNSNNSLTVARIKVRPASSKIYTAYSLPLIQIQGAPAPRPLSTSTVFVKGLVHSRDEDTLTHTPYFGDDDDDISEVLGVDQVATTNESNSIVSSQNDDSSNHDVIGVWDIAQRQTLLDLGPFYKGEEQTHVVKLVLKLVVDKLRSSKHSLGNVVSLQLVNDVADETNMDKEQVNGIWQALGLETRLNSSDIECSAETNNNHNHNKVIEIEDKSVVDGLPNGHIKAKHNSCSTVPLPYEDFMDSYRSLFCRRCFIYDCALHANVSNIQHSALQGELANENEEEGYWTKIFDDGGRWKQLVKMNSTEAKSVIPYTATTEAIISSSSERQSHPDDPNLCRAVSHATEESCSSDLTPFQKSICKRASLIFRGNIVEMSKVMGADPSAVARYVQQQSIHVRSPVHLSNDYHKRKVKTDVKKEQNFYSMKNYNHSWLKRVERAKMDQHCLFYPCDHDGLCSNENCSCITNSWFCTKHCIWGGKSRNYFRGCACKGGQCRTRSCPCFASMRECDPDLCRSCGTCSDSPTKPAVLQSCRNDCISMRRYVHVLISESTVEGAGWGLFTKHALAKGDYVSEYVGEVISQGEAERRGRIYDKVNRSYLFNLTADYVVDATRKGNKTRFINHSSKPNCCARLTLINGTMRIGIFAKDDIEPQSEIFFDYRYSESSDNKLVETPVMTVDWMKDSKMAHTISRKKNR